LSIEVKVSPLFYPYTNNQPSTAVNGSTVGECLDYLVRQFPKLKRALFDRHGRLHHHLNIYVNQASAYPEELARPVKDGDKLHIVMTISGG
jgi:molybdopterin converting factor small subunit